MYALQRCPSEELFSSLDSRHPAAPGEVPPLSFPSPPLGEFGTGQAHHPRPGGEPSVQLPCAQCPAALLRATTVAIGGGRSGKRSRGKRSRVCPARCASGQRLAQGSEFREVTLDRIPAAGWTDRPRFWSTGGSLCGPPAQPLPVRGQRRQSHQELSVKI